MVQASSCKELLSSVQQPTKGLNSNPQREVSQPTAYSQAEIMSRHSVALGFTTWRSYMINTYGFKLLCLGLFLTWHQVTNTYCLLFSSPHRTLSSIYPVPFFPLSSWASPIHLRPFPINSLSSSSIAQTLRESPSLLHAYAS